MAGPNVGQSSGVVSSKETSSEETKIITDLSGTKEKSIFDMLFSVNENGEKKTDEQ